MLNFGLARLSMVFLVNMMNERPLSVKYHIGIIKIDSYAR